MSSGINVRLGATDEISPVLRSIRATMDGLNLSTQVMVGNLKAMAVAQVFSTVQRGLAGIQSGLMKAASQQTRAIATAGDLASKLGVGMASARGILQETRIDIAEMAAALPGETAQYNQVFEQISATVAGQYKGDTEKFRTVAMDFTKRIGALASIRGISGYEAGETINRMLSGAVGFREGTNRELFEKNPLLEQNAMDVAKSMGVDIGKWQELSTKIRMEVLQKALASAARDETFAEFEGTAEAIIQGWQTKLFDPDVGLFGFFRKITAAGDRTVLDAFTGALQSWDRFSQAVGGLMEKLGIGIDPLQALVEVLDIVADVGDWANSLLDFELPKDAGWQDALDSIMAGVAKSFENTKIPAFNLTSIMEGIKQVFRSVIDGLLGLDLVALGASLGEAVANIFATVGNLGTNILMGVRWEEMGLAFGLLITKALFGLASLLRSLLLNMDFAPMIKNFGAVLLAVVRFFGGLLAGIAAGVLQSWSQAIARDLKAIAPGFKNLGKLMVQGFQWLIDIPKNTINLGKAIAPAFERLSDGIVSLFKAISDQVKPITDSVGNTIVSVLQWIADRFMGIGDWFRGWYDKLTSWLPNFGGQVQTIPDQPSILERAKGWAGEKWNDLTSPQSTTPLSTPSTTNGSTAQTVAFQPQIVVNGTAGQSSSDIADEVMQRMEQAYKSFTRQTLSIA